MNHSDFMKELCRIIGKFSETLPAGETESCFCLDNEIAARDARVGIWRNQTDVLHELRKTLGIPPEIIKEPIEVSEVYLNETGRRTTS